MFYVIFDMDGTLLDTQRICVPAFEYAGGLQGLSGVGEVVRDVCGMKQAAWSAVLKERFPAIDLEKFIPEMRDYIIKNGVVRYKEGAREILEYLKCRGIKMALASGSGPATVRHHMNVVEGLGYFDVIVAGDDVKKGKPEPDIFLECARRLGAEPSSCFVFEDSPLGIIAGHRAGMKCIGVPEIAEFSPEVRDMMYAFLPKISDAIGIFEKM